jgi:two-component system phosphate regulon sensor histidine kinase PhoR
MWQVSLVLALACCYLYCSRRLYILGYGAFDEGSAIFTRKKKLIYISPSFLKILGTALRPSGAFHTWHLPRKEVHEGCLYLLHKAQHQKVEHFETVFYKENGESLATSIKLKPLSYGRYMLIVQDLDKEKREFSLGKEFIANASHELRTPIAIIKGFVETIKDLPKVSEAMLEDIFEKILRSCSRMDDIVKNLLVLTDLDYLFSLKKGFYDVESFLDNVGYILKERHPSVQIELKHSKDLAQLHVDLPLMELALLNLLENAVKYSRDQPKISVEHKVESLEHKILIHDHGIGIPKENIPYIFDRFYAVNKPLSRKLGGAGLGLSIVKTIIDKHQGSIVVESAVGEGTTFTICLPRQE